MKTVLRKLLSVTAGLALFGAIAVGGAAMAERQGLALRAANDADVAARGREDAEARNARTPSRNGCPRLSIRHREAKR